jgi:molybdopterin molybdotransferase
LADLLSVDRALEQILESFQPLAAKTIDITLALGRVLAQDVQSSINIPPFPNSSMDGYALRSEDIAGASRESPATLRVTMDIPAGKIPDRRIESGQAARIMTGAPLPDGADAIIPVEQTDSQWTAGGDASLPAEVKIFKTVNPGDYVRPRGEDIQAGQIVLRAGTILRPQDLGVLAAMGEARVPVIRQPKVVIISTGDELVDASEPLTPGKIRDVNAHTIAGLVSTYGGIPIRLPIARDTFDEVRALFQKALAEKPDIIISSAGVSVGAFDVVRTILDELGKVNFWRVNIRPGKPLAFGQVGNVPFFGLPGNPVSAMVTFDVFARPALLKMSRRPDTLNTAKAMTAEAIQSDGRRSYLRVKLERENGQLMAHLTGTQSSGALMSMVLADGLLIVPEDIISIPAGTELSVRLLRGLEI